MASASKIAEAIARVANSNAAIGVALAAAFAALAVNSVGQQRNIEALEAEKASLLSSNKEMKKSMWSWRQQLFAEAEADSGFALVPLARLKAIYGEAPTPTAREGDASKEDVDSTSSKFVV